MDPTTKLAAVGIGGALGLIFPMATLLLLFAVMLAEITDICLGYAIAKAECKVASKEMKAGAFWKAISILVIGAVGLCGSLVALAACLQASMPMTTALWLAPGPLSASLGLLLMIAQVSIRENLFRLERLPGGPNLSRWRPQIEKLAGTLAVSQTEPPKKEG